MAFEKFKRFLQWLVFIPLDPSPTYSEGKVFYSNSEKALSYMTDQPDVICNIGQETFIRVRNNSGGTINNGQVVYVSGATGQYPTIEKAKADTYTTTKVIGVATHDIENNSYGYVTTYGIVRDINTSAYNDGDTVYLSAATAGSFVNTVPANPNVAVKIGVILYSHVTQGKLHVMPSQCWTTTASFNELRAYTMIVNNTFKSGNIPGGNYSEFESDGTLKYNGNATVWQDIDFPIIVRLTGTNIPTVATVKGNLTMPQWAVNDFNVCEIQEVIHQYRQGSTATWHIHIITAAQDATDRYVRFENEYNYSNFSEAWQANNIILTSSDLLIPANTPALTHLIFNIGNFSDVNLRIAAHIKTRLKRVASIGTAPSANPFCEMLQLHVECDTTGSRQITTK